MSGLKASEITGIVNHIISNNNYLTNLGRKKNTISLCAPAGVGKTSIVQQIAENNGMRFYKIILSQLEQVGDIQGFPIREFEYACQKTGERFWIDEKNMDRFITNPEFETTGEKRTAYCQPEWVPEDNGEPSILLIDDWTRAPVHIIQAMMEVIDRGECMSWKVPSNCHILLSENPSDGEYFVTELDEAQKTRYAKVEMKFALDEWAQWAEAEGIDSRCINFFLLNSDIALDGSKFKSGINARCITDFFNSISSLNSFSSSESMRIITNIGAGFVGQEFVNSFILFVNKKLDKLPTPQQLLIDEKDHDKAIKMIVDVVGKVDKQKYRQDIASIIRTRIINYSDSVTKSGEVKAKDLLPRLCAIIKSKCFSGDINGYLIKTLNANQKFKGILDDEEVLAIASL